MSNQLFAWLLVMECGILSLLMIPYYTELRRAPALAALPVYALWGLFIFIMGGGIKDNVLAGIYIYAAALGLLFFQAILIVTLIYSLTYGNKKNDDDLG